MKSLLQDKIIEPAIIFSSLLIIFSFLFLVFNFNKLPPEVPLFHSLPWGEEQLAVKWQLFFLPFLSLIFLIVDLLLARRLYSQNLFLSRVLALSAPVFGLLSTIALVETILLIT